MIGLMDPKKNKIKKRRFSSPALVSVFVTFLGLSVSCSDDDAGVRPDALVDAGAEGDVSLSPDGGQGDAQLPDASRPDAASPEVFVTFFDVGQGDSTLVESSENEAVLVDTGRTIDNAERLGEDLWGAPPDYTLLVISHYDADHMGSSDRFVCGPDGMPGVAGVDDDGDGEADSRVASGEYGYPGSDDFLFDSVWDRGDVEIPTSVQVEEYLAALSSLRYRPNLGDSVDLGLDGFQIEVVTIDGEIVGGESFTAEDENARSVSLLVTFGGFHLLLPGDLPTQGEDLLAAALADRGLSLDVLHLSHHGSNTSTGQSLLDLLQPEVAIVSVGDSGSCGAGFNAYGHPSQEVLDRLDASSVQMVFQTQQGGAIPETGQCSPAQGETYPRDYGALEVVFAFGDIGLQCDGEAYSVQVPGNVYDFGVDE